MEFVMFTKHLKRDGGLRLEEAGETISELGFAGADLTVRPQGYIEPADARSELTPAVEMLRAMDVSVPMLTTAITDHTDEAEVIFEVADANDVGHLKLGYWLYDGLGTLDGGLEAMSADLAEIEVLSASYDVMPAVHIHSGPYLSAEAGILARVLDEFDPSLIGAYVDPGHMALEGARDGWKMGLDLLADRIEMVAVKDFTWRKTDDGWEKQLIGVDQGLVDWPSVFAFLADIQFDGPVSFHSEYHHLSFNELLDQTRRDLSYVQGIMAA